MQIVTVIVIKINTFLPEKIDLMLVFIYFFFPTSWSSFLCRHSAEEFIQTVQSTAGMASVLLLRSAMGPGEDLATVVRKAFNYFPL